MKVNVEAHECGRNAKAMHSNAKLQLPKKPSCTHASMLVAGATRRREKAVEQ